MLSSTLREASIVNTFELWVVDADVIFVGRLEFPGMHGLGIDVGAVCVLVAGHSWSDSCITAVDCALLLGAGEAI